MVSEILVKDLKNSIGRVITIYLESGFKHRCEIISVDEEYVKIKDIIKDRIKLLRLNQIIEVNGI